MIAADGDAFDLNILAIEDEEAPYGLVLQRDAGDEHILGVLDGNQAGTAAVLAWGGRSNCRKRRRRRGERCCGCICGSGGSGRAILTPVFARSIDGTLAGDDESSNVEGVDECRGPHLLGSLPTGLHLGIIVGVAGAFEDAVLLQQQVHTLLEEDGAAEKSPLGND